MIVPFIAIILYFLSNYYIYIRFMSYLNLEHNIFSLLIILLLILSMPIGMIISKKIKKRNFLYNLGTSWFAIVIISLTFTAITDIVNIFYYSKYNYYIALTLIIISIIYGTINAQKIHIIKKKIKANFNLNLVFFSDVHLGDRYGKNELNKIVQKTIKLNPDIVLIGGDFFDGGLQIKDSELKVLEKIKVPIFMVLGNHDFYYGEKKVHEQLSKYVKILRNEIVKFNEIDIIGIDDSQIYKLDKIKHNKNSILLYHRPWNTKSFFNSNAFLMLCGHTHNGQFLPFIMNFIYKFPYGLKKYKNKYIYTTSGVLGWGPKIRLGSNNEIVNIKIENNK
ncbi:MAG: metallophosphoesterase [Candidatus Woesearchaeota archaeon]